MSQGDLNLPIVGTYSGLVAAGYMNDALDALTTKNSGAGAPANAPGGVPVLGQDWIDTTNPNLVVWSVYDGTGWRTIGSLDTVAGIWIPATGAGIGTIASAATVDLGSVAAATLQLTGATGPITSFGSTPPTGTVKTVYAASNPLITHNGTSMILPGARDLQLAAGDSFGALYLGSSNWKVLWVQRASGAAVTPLWGWAAEAIKTVDYTILPADAGTPLVANKATAITFNLPAVSGNNGMLLPIKTIGVGALTIDASGSETIDGALTLTLQKFQAVILYCNGSLWRVLAFHFAGLAPVVALADTATVAIDASLGNAALTTVMTLVATANRQLGVPTNPTSGQKIIVAHKASGGARTLTVTGTAGGFRFGSDITSLTATASGKTDYIAAIYNLADNFWDIVGVTKGF